MRNLGARWRWVVTFTSWPFHPQERTLVHTREMTVWAPEVFWTFWKREKPLAPTRIFLPFSCSVFILFPYLFLSLDCAGLLLCLYWTTHNRTHSSPRRDLFFVRAFFSFVLSVIFIRYVPLYPVSSCHLFLHNTNIHAPSGIYFLSCSVFVLLCPDCPGFCLLFLLYNTHNTYIHAPGWIQTHNPSNQAAASPRFSSRGHRDRQDSNPGPPSQ
jgi:hypothetical protein